MKSISFSAILILILCSYPSKISEKRLPLDPIVAEINEIWGISAPIGVAIATCESSLRQYDHPGHVLRGVKNSADVGIFQINVEYHSIPKSVYKPTGNILFARDLFLKFGTKPWKASQKCWSPLLAGNYPK